MKTAVTVLALTEAAKYVDGKYSRGILIQPPTTPKPSFNGANASPQRPTELKLRSSYPGPENSLFINDMVLSLVLLSIFVATCCIIYYIPAQD